MNARLQRSAVWFVLAAIFCSLATGLASASGCGPLRIQRNGGNVTLTWTGTDCRLQEATSLINCAPGTTWVDLPGGASPYVLPIVGGKKFFRTVSTNGGSPSLNIVAYVNLQLPSDPSGSGTVRSLITNPLIGTNNFLDTILPEVPDGTTIERFDVTTQSYLESIQFIGGFGWFTTDPDPNALVIDPGEGFWIFPVGPNSLTVTFVGEVPQATLVNPLPGPGQMALLSSIVPIAAPIGDLASACTLKFPAEDGDTLLTFNAVTQTFRESYTFFDGFGWFSTNPDDPGPLGPTISVGMGFVLQKAANATQSGWVQAFGAQGCPPSDLPAITNQPLDLTVLECRCATFTVAASGRAPLAYQWQRNGSSIPSANNASYTLCPVTLADNGSVFRVVITNACGSIISREALLTVIPDTTPPSLLSGSVDCVSNKFTLVFDESLDPLTAGEASNYFINGGAVAVLNATVSPDGKTVCLFTDPLVSETDYTIVAVGLTDLCGNVANELTTTLRCGCLDVLNENLTCSTNAPAKLNYSFDLKNRAGVPVKYLYLVPQNDCFKFSPSIITFSPPLADGQTAPVNVMIELTGNCPTNLCFLLAAHTTNLVECCSVSRCIQLDHAGPQLVSAVPDCATNKITVTFNEPLSPATFLGVPNFIVDDLTHLVSLNLQSASFGTDYQTVCLFTAGALSAGTQYRLTVNNVADVCGNAIAPDSRVDFNCSGDGPKLNFNLMGGSLCVSWTGNAVLESFTSLSHPIQWTATPDQSNPQCIVATGAQKFFRLRVN